MPLALSTDESDPIRSAANGQVTDDEADDFASWRHVHAPNILGSSASLIAALEVIQRSADTDCSILFTGETGTGKELFARAVHTSSPRAKGPFVAVNCAAIPEGLIESELFGHAKGAYTGASGARAGRILAANGGTLFLDEIGELPAAAQAKLLRVLQERTITPVGADKEIPVDVRIVSATHRDLEALSECGAFREDLYFRLNVIHAHLPALRERASDIPLLTLHFLATANDKFARKVEGCDAGALEALMAQTWRGNVRELANVVDRAVVLRGKGTLTAEDFRLKAPIASEPLRAANSAPVEDAGFNLKDAILEVERSFIERALERTGGNRTEAAALLGLNRTTLVEKLRRISV